MQLGSQSLSMLVATVALATAVVSLATSLLLTRSLSRKIGRISALTSALSSRAVRSFIKSTEAKRRVRKRYLVVKVIGEADKSSLNRLILESIRVLYGSAVSSLYGTRVIDFDSKSMTAVIRLRSDGRWAVLAAVGAVENISGGSIILIPLRMCGTLRKAREYARRLKC